MALEIVPAPKFRMMSSAASAPFPDVIISFHLAALRVGHDGRGAAHDLREEAEAV